MARTWNGYLESKLIKKYGASKGALLAKKYAHAFSASYQQDFSVDEALFDLELIEELSSSNKVEAHLYEQAHGDKNRLYLKILQYEKPIPLSDILPILENMNLRTYSGRPYKIVLDHQETIWISDFSVQFLGGTKLDISKSHLIFREALIKICDGQCENDGFNKLILGAGLPWREILILRLYAKYLQQIGFRFSQPYIEKTLDLHAGTARALVELFKAKFDPARKSTKKISEISDRIKANLEKVSSLDEDRILRVIEQLIAATLRTNYFQKNTNGDFKEYFSVKLASGEVPNLPLPHPLYEVFVYSPHFEAIHLRSAKVARGGIRWSDRREDFRTEILGLMKAQKVKNAIIVPSGAKGGFVLKTFPSPMTREALLAEVVFCYKSFMRGLLDITDNLKDGKIIHPKDVVCYDDDDPYLVVAADKGTATFSDIANSISKEYGFWLGDAFASGGSAGYDHKAIGITARGAWESIKRHFHSLGIDVFAHDFTVVGIGDMSGDVFGNGMLYSEHIKLVAAFDHRHIFIDPTPLAKKSFQERSRLFRLPTSSWGDYDASLISKGGGVFPRTSKSITITPEMREVLGITDHSLAPNDLIRAILKAPVDLLFNGGIGTYVKATHENHAQVGDKANEFCRVDGHELRCKVVGEGGNLGFTQLGRIEYALNGGLINTDFIDNSGGVDCSDHEVNIKILLNHEMVKGDLTEKKRNALLVSMTDQVANLVLKDNYHQALAMAFSVDGAAPLLGLYQVYLAELEKLGIINRAVEFLPDDRILLERKAKGIGLTSPELAVLLAYTKIHVKNEILKSDVPEDPFLSTVLYTAFPEKLSKLYADALKKHPLRREIIAAQLGNRIVNSAGITFVYRIQTETGAPIGDIIRAHTAAVRIFEIRELNKLVGSLELKISTKLQYELLHHIRNLTNLATRWFLQGNRLKGNLEQIIEHYFKRVKQLELVIPGLITGVTKNYLNDLKDHFSKEGISDEISSRLAITRAIYTALNIIEVSTLHHFDLIKAAQVYFDAGSVFHLVWFRDQIAADRREGHWNTLSRLTLRDELDGLQRLLTVVILKSYKKEKDAQSLVERWAKNNPFIMQRWENILELLYAAPNVEYAMFFVALRELATRVSAIEV